MYFPLYLAALAVSAGIVGAFGRRLVALGGYVTDFDAGVSAALMVGGGYVVIEAAYGAFIQLFKPYKSKGPYLAECLSLLSAVILVPFLLNMPIPWPHPKLAQMEPALYFLAFAAVHVFFKLATLFAATQAIPATPVRVLPYVAVAAIALLGARHGFEGWYGSLKGVRTAELAAAEPVRTGDTYAPARLLTEELQYRMGPLPEAGAHLTMRWANLAEADPLEQIYVSIHFYGDDGEAPLDTVTNTLSLGADGWFELRVPPDAFPEDAVAYGLSWALDEEPEWVRQTGLRPVHTSGKQVLLSGPFAHPDPAAFDRPNLVVVLVEGLGADHMDLLGYERATSPALTALARRSVVWENAFTPCPDTYSTTMSIFTGQPPLMHGSTGAGTPPLPPGTAYLPERLEAAGYATVAFTEGEGADRHDLVLGSGVEHGFQLFNPVYPQVPLGTRASGPGPLVPEGARVTLQRAAEWIREHRDQERFLLFIRLRELSKPYKLKRYGNSFVGPRTLDVYDNAVADVDKQLGLFLDRLREMDSMRDTCILITSPYGLDFSEPGRGVWRRGGPGVPRLTEESLRVPLILSLPEGIGRIRRGLVSLEALGPTLADLGGVTLATALADRSLLEQTPPDNPVSVLGDPIALSLRTQDWRFNWQSGLTAGTFERVEAAKSLALYNIADYKESKWNKDFQQQEPEAVRTFTRQLESYIRPYAQAGAAAP